MCYCDLLAGYHSNLGEEGLSMHEPLREEQLGSRAEVFSLGVHIKCSHKLFSLGVHIKCSY